MLAFSLSVITKLEMRPMREGNGDAYQEDATSIATQ